MKSIKIQNKRRNSKVCMKEPRWMTTKRITLTKCREQESPEKILQNHKSGRFVVLQILGRGVVMKISPFAGRAEYRGEASPRDPSQAVLEA